MFLSLKSQNTNFPLRLLHNAFEQVKFEDRVLEYKTTDDRIVHVHKENFLCTIGVVENLQVFQVVEPSHEEFQAFLFQIRYKCEFKAKEFKKPALPRILDSVDAHDTKDCLASMKTHTP